MTTPIEPCALCGCAPDVIGIDVHCPNENCKNHEDGAGRSFNIETWGLNQRERMYECLIKKLTESRDHWRNESIKAEGTIALMHSGITDLEAKLNVAVEALEFCAANDLFIETHDGLFEYKYNDWFGDKARAALKEIEK